MRICVIGKFPPIQGGVSRHTYWSAHALAARGHDVHVVTNAREVGPPFRMHMRAEDWQRCEAQYALGAVTVHWTDPVDRSQFHIPMASPFVSKLAAIAVRAHSAHPFDVVYSHYMEPYGIAGYLVSQMTGAPHVVRMAGSDAGRLWRHPQFEPLYDHVLRSAKKVIAVGVVAQRAVERGVDSHRVVAGGEFFVPEDLFTPDGPSLDFASLRTEIASDRDFRDLLWGEFAADRPYFGVCGKLGESKGSFSLLDAMQRLKLAGVNVGLVALAHGPPAVEKAFRARARKLGLVDNILQIPFLPHWRVPEFLRGCLAACCLEQDFPIGFHSPIIPREVLLCGTCLVASTEVMRKLPAYGRLPDGYGCVAIEDVDDVDVLSERLAAIARDPGPASVVGMRGRDFVRELQQDVSFPHRLEQVLESAVTAPRVPRKSLAHTSESREDVGDDRFPLSQIAAAAMAKADESARASSWPALDLTRARQVLAALERRINDGEQGLASLAAAVEAEVAIAATENEASDADIEADPDPLFRLRVKRWAIDDADLARLFPVRDPRIRLLEFDTDISEFLGARTAADLPTQPTRRHSFAVVFGRGGGARRDPLLVDALTARILQLSDGTRLASEIAGNLDREFAEPTTENNLKWIERLFAHGLIVLRERPVDSARGEPLRSTDVRQHRGLPVVKRPRSRTKARQPV